MLSDSNVPMLVVAIPDFRQLPEDGYGEESQRFVANLAADSGVRFLDVTAALRLRADIETAYLMQYYPDYERGSDDLPSTADYKGNGHMSAYGYRVVAEEIAEYVTSSPHWLRN